MTFASQPPPSVPLPSGQCPAVVSGCRIIRRHALPPKTYASHIDCGRSLPRGIPREGVVLLCMAPALRYVPCHRCVLPVFCSHPPTENCCGRRRRRRCCGGCSGCCSHSCCRCPIGSGSRYVPSPGAPSIACASSCSLFVTVVVGPATTHLPAHRPPPPAGEAYLKETISGVWSVYIMRPSVPCS